MTESETVRQFAERLALEALAEDFSAKRTTNEAYDHRADRAAWRQGEEYEVERYRPRTLEEMVEDSCSIVVHSSGEDGYGSHIRSLTYREVVTSVVDRLIERGIIRGADTLLTPVFLCGERVDGHVCLTRIGADGTCPKHPPGDGGLTAGMRQEAAQRWQDGPARRPTVDETGTTRR